jgi:predicted ATPase
MSSLDLARRQGALAWELRSAMSLARLLRDRQRVAEACDLLSRTVDRFSEGFGTADLRAATTLMADLSA